nr:hypothetical protein [uncultured Oscillibacter sp.]
MAGKMTADQALSNCLRQGERVLWQSGTMSFPLLEKGESWKIIGKWIGTVVVTAVLLALYTGQGREWSARAVAVILLIAVVMLLSPVIERRSLLGQRYWITDQRAILMTRDQTFYYMELSEIDDFQLLRDRTAGDCLVLGGCLFEEVDRQLRWRACHPKTDIQNDSQRGVAQGLAFFSVEDGAGAAECLRQHQTA